MNEDRILLCCRKLNFTFKDKRALFEDLDIGFERGSFNHIKGPSGSGKSTFLRLLNRLEQPESGEIFFRDRPLSDYPPPVLRHSICYIQQTPTLVPGTVSDNLLISFRFRINRPLPPPEGTELIRLMEDFGLRGIKLSDQATNLSGGQKQRLCLLRSLLLKPEILLLDEPVSALDVESREAVESVIGKLNAEMGITILLASHQHFYSSHIPITVYEISDRKIFRRDMA